MIIRVDIVNVAGEVEVFIVSDYYDDATEIYDYVDIDKRYRAVQEIETVFDDYAVVITPIGNKIIVCGKTLRYIKTAVTDDSV